MYVFDTLIIFHYSYRNSNKKYKNSFSFKLRFRTFTYFYHDVMRLIKGDASFPRVPRLVDFTRVEKRTRLVSACVTISRDRL